MSLRRRMGPAPRLRPAPPARPVHAGILAGWERLAFAAVFALMLAFVATVTISSARARGPGAPVAAGHPPRAGRAPAPAARPGSETPTRPGDRAARAAWDHRLAAALAPVLRGHAGSLAVGVIDRSTGSMAVYHRRLRFDAGGIVMPEILAALLLQHGGAGPGLTDADESLATRMIQASDGTAATRLWDLAGRARGLTAADAVLGLRHTTPGPGEAWGLTTTTVADQLTLMSDLTTASSPLSSGARAYELSLLRGVPPRRGGVSAAGAGDSYALRNGWRPAGPDLWVVSSIGVLDHDGQRLLLAVLSRGQPTAAAGRAEDAAAAAAAAACITGAGPRDGQRPEAPLASRPARQVRPG